MEILKFAFLGMVQGLGEFLPISSSAHLILVPWLFNFKDPGLGFSVALHLGTLCSVLVYFRNDVWLLIKGFWHSLFKETRDFNDNIYQKLSWYLIIASVPGAIVGKLLEEKAETVFRQPLLVALTLTLGGLVLWYVDSVSAKTKNLNKIGVRDSLVVGMSQALAIIPGISRSGSTMIAALALKFKREDAARFSFLMSMPIILGAGLLKISDFTKEVALDGLIVGFVSSAVFGFLAIKYLLKYLSSHDFKVFVWYRLALAFFVFLIFYFK